jgi:signal transduction histidine kinase
MKGRIPMNTSEADSTLARQSGTSTNDLQRLTRTLEAARLLQSTLNLHQLTTIILEMVRNEIPVERVTFFVVDRARRTLCSLVAQGVDGGGIALPMGMGIAGFAAATGEPQDVLDVYADCRFDPEFDHSLGYKTNDILAWPIMDTNRNVTGVIELLNRMRPITAADHEFLGDISGFIALALENSVLHEEIQQKVRMETELAQLRERLVQMDRMVLVSEVLSTLQNELATPLIAIETQIRQLRGEWDATPNVIRHADIITTAAARSRQTVHGFLDFVQKKKGARETLDVGSLVQETMALRAFNWTADGIVVESHLEDTPPVKGNAAEIQHALMNLIKNAEDAVSANQSKKRLTIRVHPSRNLRKLQIEVEDNGSGVAVQLYERIFEPFFSTKHETVRSGLGLTIASRIIQEHGGEIVFQSTPGQGSVFTIELPV